MSTNVIRTDLANCVDCYRCVRSCPVKAISVTGGQARIDDSLCIQCGTCVHECPQHAKVILSSLEKVKELISSGRPVAASIAPSFPAAFSDWRVKRIPSALRLLGFKHVGETAEGARLVTDQSLPEMSQGSLCTACPTVVNYVERYYPEHLSSLMPLTSPMIAHGKLLKEELGEQAAVVFIGPCAAKILEARRPENAGVVDFVLTFKDLQEWFDDAKLNLATISESDFDQLGHLGDARLFPLQGGMLKTAGIECDGTQAEIIHLSGSKDLKDILELPSDQWGFDVAEPLFCRNGCLGGPGYPEKKSHFVKRRQVIEYNKAAGQAEQAIKGDIDLKTGFQKQPKAPDIWQVSDAIIDEVLERTGKQNLEDRLNCGACGYNSCREKAAAIALGMAEESMCMPQMRKLAQQRTDKIIETSPNGVVILNEELHIIHMNPAFRRMFLCNDNVLGRPISYLLNGEGFEKVKKEDIEVHEAIRTKYGVRYHEYVYSLVQDKQYVGIFSNMNNMKMEGPQIDLIKSQTLEQAKQLLDHQVKFAQELAHYLGKSTAQSEIYLQKMMDLYEDEK